MNPKVIPAFGYDYLLSPQKSASLEDFQKSGFRDEKH